MSGRDACEIVSKGYDLSKRRAALQLACMYRMVLEAAVMVIAGVVPVDLLALEKKRIHVRWGAGRATGSSR